MKPLNSILSGGLALALAIALAPRLDAAVTTINSSVTSVQTWTSGTLDITSTGSVSVSTGSAAVTGSGNNVVLDNSGTISNTSTKSNARGVRVTGGGNVQLINESTGSISTVGDDAVQAAGDYSVSLVNYGTIKTTGSNGQGVDFNKILTGSNSITNYGTILGTGDDGVRPGVNGTVVNTGTIQAISILSGTSYTSSDGIDAQNNSGVSITNSGAIIGGRHGITGGAVDNTVTFTMTITNNAGGSISGTNGAGINIDGFNAKETVTVNNAGTITGNGVTGDGDGIDVDGVVNITNSGVIRSLNSYSATGTAQSEGITVGGGTIVNTGTISGEVATGNTTAVGRGITFAGVDTTGTAEPIYANSSVDNSGLIKGQNDSAIAVDGGASGFTVTITNRAGGVIEGGGTNAAIRTGADNDTINNSGTIRADGTGKAIDMGGGNNTLNITGGAASIIGDISGGTGGTNTLSITPGAGNKFSYTGSISNFSNVQIHAGMVTFSGSSTYTGDTTITSGGKLVVANTAGSATGSGTVHVQNGGTLAGAGAIGGNVSVEAGGTIAAGNGGGTLAIAGNLEIAGGSTLSFELGSDLSTSDLLAVSGGLSTTGSGVITINLSDNGGMTAGTYTVVTYSSKSSNVSASNFQVGSVADGYEATVVVSDNAISVEVQAVPEPSTGAILALGSLTGLGWMRLRRRKATV